MKTPKKRHSGMLMAFLILLLAVGGISVAGWIVLRPDPQQLQGQAEAREVRISGKIAGRILRFPLSEGTEVKKGDTLVLLESPELHAKLQQAASAEDAAIAQDRKAQKGTRAEQIATAYEVWQKAEVGSKLAETTFRRVSNMFNEGVVPAQKKDEAEAAFEAAQATSRAARSQYEMAMNGAEKEDKQAAAAMVNRAKGAVSEVESYLSETLLRAPINGEISDIFPEEGELVGAGAPIMSLVDLSDQWVVFNIREDQMSGVKMGKEFEAQIPALGNKTVKLRVNFIKSMASYATFKATKANGGFDVKTFEVHARPLAPIDGLRPGMSLMVDYSQLNP